MKVQHPRDPRFERELTAHAARMYGVADADLSDFAQQRADTHGGPTVNLDRDFGREALEELADARNYSVWWLQQSYLVHHRDQAALVEGREAVLLGMGAVVLGAHHISRARDLLR